MLKSTDWPNKTQSETSKNPGSTSEQYDALVRQLQVHGNVWNHNDLDAQAFGVTSCSRREGVTTVACNLAIAAAKVASGPVLLVDANVANPGVDKAMRIKSSRGFVNALRGESPLFDLVIDSKIKNLSLMLSGKLKKKDQQPSYDPEAIRELFDNLKQVFHTIIVDLPPIQPLTTCFSLAPCLEGVLWVIESEKVNRNVAARTRRRLAEINADVLGVVYNKLPKRLEERFL